MKQLLIIIGLIGLTLSCNSNKEQVKESDKNAASKFGADIDENGSIPIAQLVTEMNGKTEMQAKVEGKITESCKKKGCWMNIDRGDGSVMKVTFKDYGFFVPKDCGGKTAVMQGRAYMDTVSVEMLRHYAEDAGKSEEEIAKINDPSLELTFEADGVIIK